MNYASTAEKQSATRNSHGVQLKGRPTLQRNTNGCDAEALCRLVSNHAAAGHGTATSLIPAVQTRMTVSKADDPLEKEAERTAEKVMTKPATLQRQAGPKEEEEPLQAVPIQRQAGPEEEEEPLQAVPIQRQAGSEEEEEPLQAVPIQRQAGPKEEEEPLQASGSAGGVLSEDFQGRIRSTKGAGEPLPEPARAFMESRLSHDFGNVRIHTDSKAVQMNREIGALAFTHGSDIYFNEGMYSPDTSQGKRLLAHELAHTIQQGASKVLQRAQAVERPEPGQQAEDVSPEAELAASAAEAEAATDPVPAEKARKEAVESIPEEAAPEEGPRAVEEAQEEKAGVKEAGKGAAKKEAAAAGGAAPAARGEEPKGEAGQYLKQKSAGVCGRAAAKTALLAENEQTHDDAEEKTVQAEKAVEPPAEEGQAQSNAAQVEDLDGETPPEPNEQEAKKTLDDAIERSVPEKIKDLNEFKSKGKARVIGNEVLGRVRKDIDGVKKTYDKIETPPPAKKPEKAPEELPPEEVAPETPPLDLGKDAVPQLKKEHTDLSEFDRQSDELLEREGLKEEQLEMVDEGELLEAKKERKKLKQNAGTEPARLQDFAAQQALMVEKDLKEEEVKSRAEMRNKRLAGLSGAKEKQKKTKTALELKREAVTKRINSIYERAKKSVTEKLDNLEKQSLKAFDQGQAKASGEFEYEVNRDINRWKRKRYSGLVGKFKWAKDKLFGIDDFPEVKAAFENARRNYVAKIDRLIAGITKENRKVIAGCKEEIAAARKEIRKYVESLGPDLKKIGQQAMAEMKTKLDEMDGFIDRKKDELAKKLCSKKEEAIKKIDEKIEKMKEEMSGALAKLGNLLLEAALKFFKWALKKAGYSADRLMSIINKGKAVVKKIVGDPVGFIRNIINAVKNGVNNFVANIKKHLVGGLINWLTGAMGDIGIQLPPKFDLKGIIYIVLQILGLTWSNIRRKLVKRLGEKAVSAAEKTLAIVKKLVTEGPMALWEEIKAKAAEIKQQVMEGIRNWAIVELVKQGVIKLLSFLNPAGAIVQAILAIYNTIMFFVENWNRIVRFVKTVIDSIGDIAMGKISAAAAAVERAMAMTVPIILNFLARLLNLSGIGKAVKKIIMKIRKPIDKVIDRALDFIAKKAKALFRKGKAAVKKGKEAVKRLVEWWRIKKRFKAGGESHSLQFKGKGRTAQLMVASTPKTLDSYISELKSKGISNELIERIKAKALEIDSLKKEKTGKDIQMTKAQGEKISRKLDELARLLAEAGGDGELPPSIVSFSPHTEHGDINGGVMEAKPLSLRPGNTSGSIPTQESKLWNAVKQRKGVYVRGHLLNHHLHGPGTKENLTPITNSLNQEMESRVESKAKKAVLGERQVVWYKVTAEYSGHPARKYIPEESWLITGFKFVLKEMKKKKNAKGDNPGDWEVGSDLPGYSRSLSHKLPPDEPVGTVRQEVNLSKDSEAVIAGSGVEGLTPDVAAKIVETRNKRSDRRFYSYEQLGIESSVVENMKKAPWIKLF